MPSPPAAPPARVTTRREGTALVVVVGGRWRITEPHPDWSDEQPEAAPTAVRFAVEDLESWDSSLVLFALDVEAWCKAHGVPGDDAALPAGARDLLARMRAAGGPQSEEEHRPNFVAGVGLATHSVLRRIIQLTRFVGECVLGFARLLRQPGKFRWRDCLYEMQQCGAMGLPITGLIAFLVGVTLAYTGAIILRQFGADIWVADLIGLSMTREMGAVMTAVVLAGRTGAAYAAELGNMKANEEIDALETLGIRAVDFLVMPRIIALVAMMPLLTLYADALGIIGGMVIALFLLDIQPSAYWVEMLTIVDMSDLMTGLIKAVTFGAIIALAGCLRGLQADRSAAGVGRAATSAVVTSILLVVVADALFAVIFEILGW